MPTTARSTPRRYHRFGSIAAGRYWDGTASFTSILPSGTGTDFMENLTAFVYTLTGASKLAGFAIFSWMAFWGVAMYIKAACLAVPGLLARRYAVLCACAPSLVYWPSSIGKEAWMMLTLGAATLGFAALLSSRRLVGPIVLSAAGLTGAALVRPHLAGIWLGGLFAALLVAAARRRSVYLSDGYQGNSRKAILFVTVLASVRVRSSSDRSLSAT